MNFTTSLDLTWDQFASCHANRKEAFEDLTRQLFNLEFCPGVHLHSCDNNPGVEVEPVLVITKDGEEKWISFQAKHFNKTANYNDIKDSCEKAVTHYKGRLDIIYLYCNLNLNPDRSDVFKKAITILQDAGIKMELITNNAILDMLRDKKYSRLALPYFGLLQLSEEWFANKANAAFDYLDERFNRLFNVDTEISAKLSLFLRDDAAVAALNKRKKDLIEEAQKELNHGFLSADENTYLSALLKEVAAIPDIENNSIPDVLKWDRRIKADLASEMEKLETDLTDIKARQEELKANREGDQKYRELHRQENHIEELLLLASRLSFTIEEQALIQNKILFIKGEAGTGKSHLLANELHTLIADEKGGVLILGQALYSSDNIEKQILNTLDIDYSLQDFLSVLDNYGIVHNQIIPFMVDAINETWYRDMWKVGLDKLVRVVESTETVRLIVTYRNEYNNALLSDSMKRRVGNGSIITMSHPGFCGVEIEALNSFLNYYNIPFSPTFYFEYEFSNPLFLSLFCRTYQKGEEQSLPALYDRMLAQVNKQVCGRFKLEIDEDRTLLADMVEDFCEECVRKKRRSLTRKELVNLHVWKEWGLQGKESRFITEFVREKFFSDIVLQGSLGIDDESYYFAYDQMFDYYYAKLIVREYDGEAEKLSDYLSKNVLDIKDGRVGGYGENIFIIACVLCGKDKSLQIFDSVLSQVENQRDRYNLVHAFLQSYSWRNADSIGEEELREILQTYPITCKDLCNLFIFNSTKLNHPYNAEFMHEYLISLPINKRDCEWTIQINGLVDADSRLWQMVKLYERGKMLEYESEEQKKLLLILFSWLLTSSNRTLRDHTSKAIVEILKDNFYLCEWLLKKFENVNDPYVIQRLYTIVVGAVLKRINQDREVFRSLASYVYSTIFGQEYVYPDILLRDSARTIIERYIYENPSDCSFNSKLFRPPYKSHDIPVVERRKYEDSEEDKKQKHFGIWNITSSLSFEGMGMYGDFGRYVFQSAIDYFDIPGSRRHNGTSLLDDPNSFEGNLYYYALQFIFEELGYTNELFGEYDSSLIRYSYASRSEVLKTERIGKKYEWIAMYNILARLSDRYKIRDYDEPAHDYRGAWEPDVRDFDPTYNHELIAEPGNVPSFAESDAAFLEVSRNNYFDFGEIDKINLSEEKSNSDKAVEDWLLNKVEFFKTTAENLIIKDQSKEEWIVLSRYVDKKAFIKDDINGNLKKFDTWSWTVPFIAKRDEAESIVCRILHHRRGNIHGISEYDLGIFSGMYNREYPWSPSCQDIRDEQWKNLEFNNYSYESDRSVEDAIKVPKLDWNSGELKDLYREEATSDTAGEDDQHQAERDAFEKKLNSANEEDIEKFIDLIKQYVDANIERHNQHETVVIGRVMPAATSLNVSFQYDATAFDGEGTGYSVTCLSPDITEKLNLRQENADGFFYDQSGCLAVIDTEQYGGHTGIVIRKKLLDKYLEENQMSLFWVIYGEKQIFAESHMTQQWSEWEGVLLYKDGKPVGRLQGFRENRN